MKKVEKHKIKKTEDAYQIVKELSHISNNLYNRALFLVRNNFIFNKTETGYRKYLNFYALDKILKKEKDSNYYGLPVKTSQQVLRVLDKNWKSFFKSIKVWKQNPELFTGRPKLPNYRKKGGLNQVILTNQQCKLKENIVKFPKIFNGYTIKMHKQVEKINQVRILPAVNHFIVEIVYTDNQEVKFKEDNNKYLGIDLGLDNLIAAASNTSQGVLISGKGLKAKNKYFNNKIASLKSQLPKNQYTSKKIQLLYLKRKNIMNDYLHKASRKIEEYLDTNNTCFIPDKCLTALNCDIQTVQKHISFNTKAIRQTKHYDDETESWVGERGYWLDKRN